MYNSIEDMGAAAGRAAADICKAHTNEGNLIRRILFERVEAAKAEADKMKDSKSEDDRAVGIYWISYCQEFASAFAGAK